MKECNKKSVTTEALTCWTFSSKLAPCQVCWLKVFQWWKYIFFQTVTWLNCVMWSKGYMALRMGTSCCKLVPCLVWCPWVFCRSRYNVFNLSRDLTWPFHCGVMQIYGWQLLALCHHPHKLCDHKHCGSGDKKFLICHVTSRQHMFKGLY